MKKEVCIECKKRPIFIKKTSQCKICYHLLYNQQYKRGKRRVRIDNIPRLKLTLKNKYGSEILTDFENLNYGPSGSLTDIGKKYGFTRERARQIYKIFNRHGFLKIKRARTAKIQDIIREMKYKLSYREKHYKGNIGKAAKSEAIVDRQCKNLGLHVIVSRPRYMYDLLINDYKVDVKSATKAGTWPKKCNYPYFHFHMTLKQKINCDFIICYVFPWQTIYVFPVSKIKSRSIYIRDSPDREDKLEFKEAWELLE